MTFEMIYVASRRCRRCDVVPFISPASLEQGLRVGQSAPRAYLRRACRTFVVARLCLVHVIFGAPLCRASLGARRAPRRRVMEKNSSHSLSVSCVGAPHFLKRHKYVHIHLPLGMTASEWGA